MAEVPIISEFSDVLSDEMPSFPPDREVGFVIDLVSDTTPIFRELYDWPHLSLGSSRHSYRSCWIRGLSDQISLSRVFISSLLGRRKTVDDCALTTKCSTR